VERRAAERVDAGDPDFRAYAQHAEYPAGRVALSRRGGRRGRAAPASEERGEKKSERSREQKRVIFSPSFAEENIRRYKSRLDGLARRVAPLALSLLSDFYHDKAAPCLVEATHSFESAAEDALNVLE